MVLYIFVQPIKFQFALVKLLLHLFHQAYILIQVRIFFASKATQIIILGRLSYRLTVYATLLLKRDYSTIIRVCSRAAIFPLKYSFSSIWWANYFTISWGS